MHRTWHVCVLFVASTLFAAGAVVPARGAAREEEREGRPRREQAERRDADVRLDQIAAELKQMQEQLRKLGERVADLRGGGGPAPGRRPEGMGPPAMRPGGPMGPMMEQMRERMREMMRQRMESMRGEGRPEPRGGPGEGWRERDGRPGWRSHPQGREHAEHPLLDRMLDRLEDRIEQFRHGARHMNPRMAAERLRDALRMQLKRLDRFLEETRPDADMKRHGPKPEHRGRPHAERED